MSRHRGLAQGVKALGCQMPHVCEHTLPFDASVLSHARVPR